VPIPPKPTASNITIAEALQLLDADFAGLKTGVSRGEYALWLGSGISRGRVVGLNGVIRKLIEFLRTRADPNNEGCVHRRALDEVLIKASLSAEEKTRVDYAIDSAAWPDIDAILVRLSERYSRVLDVTIEGQPASDYLLWEGADFTRTFANQEADAEHLCIAVLVAEGVVSELVSANWDGLLESAAQELGLPLDAFRICVTGSDFRGPATAARLMKFHGCALRAIENEGTYRPLLIARWTQIVNWAVNNAFAAMRDELATIAAQKRTLMIGLSAQDPNIQNIFQLARNKMVAWQWSDASPPHVFAEDKIGEDQQIILRTTYGEEAFNANRAAIEARSCVRAYGKPLLVSLVLSVIADKLVALLDSAHAPGLSSADRITLHEGISTLRDYVANRGDADKLDFIRNAVRHFSRAKIMLQEGRVQLAPKPPYRAITDRARHFIQNDANIASTGQREVAAALALLGLGTKNGLWKVRLDDPASPNSGALRVASDLSNARVIFVANSDVDLLLFNDGTYMDDDEDVIIVHAADVQPRQKRSPARQLRTGKTGARHISIGRLLREAQSVDHLHARFREEAAL
jgi:hypothetical protein